MDKSIKEMFEKKNKDILLNNLEFDLLKNIDSLIDTINNIYYLEFETANKNIINILKDSNITNMDKYIKSKLDDLKNDRYNKIINLINMKKNMLLDYDRNMDFTEVYMDNYYEFVLESTKNIKEEMLKYNYFYKVKDDINAYIKSISNNDLVIDRIDDYIVNRLIGKLNTKIHMEIMLRDNNLINKAKEVYLRYIELTEKTINKNSIDEK